MLDSGGGRPPPRQVRGKTCPNRQEGARCEGSRGAIKQKGAPASAPCARLSPHELIVSVLFVHMAEAEARSCSRRARGRAAHLPGLARVRRCGQAVEQGCAATALLATLSRGSCQGFAPPKVGGGHGGEDAGPDAACVPTCGCATCCRPPCCGAARSDA